MKFFLLISFSISLISCQNTIEKNKIFEERIDRLEKKINTLYKSGFGELMRSIQAHHAKLWFAGINRNWQLADFEIYEINEVIEAIEQYQKKRPETHLLSLIKPAVNQVNEAVKMQDLDVFKEAYKQLTYSCNECHKETNFEFNIVKIPDKQQFSNQVFKVQP